MQEGPRVAARGPSGDSRGSAVRGGVGATGLRADGHAAAFGFLVTIAITGGGGRVGAGTGEGNSEGEGEERKRATHENTSRRVVIGLLLSEGRVALSLVNVHFVPTTCTFVPRDRADLGRCCVSPPRTSGPSPGRARRPAHRSSGRRLGSTGRRGAAQRRGCRGGRSGGRWTRPHDRDPGAARSVPHPSDRPLHPAFPARAQGAGRAREARDPAG